MGDRVCMRWGGGTKKELKIFYSKKSTDKRPEKSRGRNTTLLIRHMEIKSLSFI